MQRDCFLLPIGAHLPFQSHVMTEFKCLYYALNKGFEAVLHEHLMGNLIKGLNVDGLL